MGNPHNIQVGQKLFFVRTINRNRSGQNEYWVEVGKVGRQWAKIGFNGRVNLTTLHVDGGIYSSPGRCYLTDKEYLDEQERQRCWDSIARFARNMHRVPDIPIDKLRMIADALGIAKEP